MSKKDTPDITPDRSTMKLTEKQASLVTEAMQDVNECRQSLEALQGVLNRLLAMVQPEGATGFDVQAMTFYSEETPSEPKGD